MKVLHIAGPAQGGISRHIDTLSRGLLPLGVDCQLYSPARLRNGPALYRRLCQERWDLVHCHGFQGGAVGRIAAALADVPAIATIHNTLQISGFSRCCALAGERMLRNRTVSWIAVSTFLENYAWQRLGLPRKRVKVVANGIALPAALPPRQPEPVVGMVARLIPAKGVDVFLRALQLLRPEIPRLRGIVIGSGPEAAKLMTLSRVLGLSETVEFYGQRNDVEEQLQKIAVFVLPSRSEGLGISVLEAMAAGVPVITTPVGGLPELVRHRQTGLVAQVNDYANVARWIKELLGDPALAERLRRQAFAHVANNFSLLAMLEGTHAVYRQAANA